MRLMSRRLGGAWAEVWCAVLLPRQHSRRRTESGSLCSGNMPAQLTTVLDCVLRCTYVSAGTAVRGATRPSSSGWPGPGGGRSSLTPSSISSSGSASATETGELITLVRQTAEDHGSTDRSHRNINHIIT